MCGVVFVAGLEVGNGRSRAQRESDHWIRGGWVECSDGQARQPMLLVELRTR